MRKIGSAGVGCALLLAATSAAAAEQVEFYQQADRKEVGTEDTFHLTIVAANAPTPALVKFPGGDHFEVLSKSESTEMSYQASTSGKGSMKRVQKWVLIMRANHTGVLTLPASTLVTDNRTYKTEPIQMTVKKGRLGGSQAVQRPRGLDPFGRLPNWPGLEDDEDGNLPDVDLPRSDSDLFLRSSLDRSEAYLGQQVTLSVYIYSRVDLSEVSSLNMPKLDGFWSEDIDSPTQLAGERKLLNGIPYRAYLLKRRALFAMKPGKLEIAPAEVDVVTGFLFAGRRVHRVGNALQVSVRPLPEKGRPPGPPVEAVGSWRLSAEASGPRAELGQPVSVRIRLEGRGNLRGVAVPPLTAPAALRVYDPTASEKLSPSKGQIAGQRVQEYLVIPQQTGAFTLPALSLPYFDPEMERYQVARTEPISLVVVPGSGGAKAVSPGTSTGPALKGKNVLTQAQGLRALRPKAQFSSPAQPVWKRAYFAPALTLPPVLWIAVGLFGRMRSRMRQEDETTLKKRKARAARRRLAEAEKLESDGSADAFYAEVEKALLGFLEAQLEVPVGGLSRDRLAGRLKEAGLRPEQQRRILTVLDQCDLGRFAQGAGDVARDKVLDDAADAMEGWEHR